jgi:alkanesulfonate monooxygenase SsuD/methylene tetrahydromethanopterin reductase-like flavin-dependent oxidoreductase (luciferase family)
VRIGVKPGQWGWRWDELVDGWRAAEECGFELVSCFDHVTAAPDGQPAWDAPSLLTAMAGVVERPRLAVDVLNSSLRHPFLLAGQLAVAQAASGGRVEVGLGAGSAGMARFDNRALGLPFRPLADRLRRLEKLCILMPALWRGESVDDDELGLVGASLGPLGIEPPPVIVGGKSEAAMAVAARAAEGWNANEPDPDAYERLARRMDELCAETGRSVTRTVQFFDRSLGPDVRERLAGFADAGATTVTFVISEDTGPEAVRRLAEAVL